MTDADDIDQPEDNPDERSLNDFIDDLLSKYRPERYASGERSWLEPVIEALTNRLDGDDIQKVLKATAEYRVNAREGVALRRIYKTLRAYFETGQLPLGWGEENWLEVFKDVLTIPVNIDGESRVQFGAMNPNDWVLFELNTRREDALRREAIDRACRGAASLAELMQAQQVQRVDQIKNVILRQGE